MSENDSGTTDEEQSVDNEHIVAVVAHDDFGTEMLAKNAIKKVLDVVEQARDSIGFELDRVAYFEGAMSDDNPTGEMGGDVVKQAFKAYNASVPEQQRVPGAPIGTPWDDTDGKNDSELRERQDGTKFWMGAPEFRDQMIARKADRLIVVEEGDFTDRIITEFQQNDKPVYNHDIETIDINVEL